MIRLPVACASAECALAFHPITGRTEAWGHRRTVKHFHDLGHLHERSLPGGTIVEWSRKRHWRSLIAPTQGVFDSATPADPVPSGRCRSRSKGHLDVRNCE